MAFPFFCLEGGETNSRCIARELPAGGWRAVGGLGRRWMASLLSWILFPSPRTKGISGSGCPGPANNFPLGEYSRS